MTKVLRSIIAVFFMVALVVGFCFLVRFVQARQHNDAMIELMQKHKIETIEDSSDIPNSSIAQELYYASNNNSTVNFDNYYANLSLYNVVNLPEFFNPTTMYLEYIDGKWDGKATSGNHTLLFDDGSVLSAEILFDNILHISYDDGLLYLPDHNYYLTLPEHHYNLYVLPDGTRVGSPHQPAAFRVTAPEFDGCIVFEDNLVYCVNGKDVYSENLHFNFGRDVIQWYGFDNGVFIFVAKVGENIELWRCIRGDMTLIESSHNFMSLETTGYHANSNSVSVSCDDYSITFSHNGSYSSESPAANNSE